MNKYKSKGVVLFALLTVLIIAFIWSNSLKSGAESGAQSGAVTKVLRAILDPKGTIPEESFHHFVRKTAHFTEFAMLGLAVGGLFGAIFLQCGDAFRSLPMLTVLLVAVMDEYIQFFTGRGSAITDVVLDFSGGLFGLGVAALAVMIKKKK